MSAQSGGGAADKRPIKRFKLEPVFTHHRSEGLTRRRNAGSVLQGTHKRG